MKNRCPRGPSNNLSKKTRVFDVIYNPKETQFLKKAKENGNRIENGKFMFIYQANQSFSIWNNVIPKIDEEVLNLLGIKNDPNSISCIFRRRVSNRVWEATTSFLAN